MPANAMIPAPTLQETQAPALPTPPAPRAEVRSRDELREQIRTSIQEAVRNATRPGELRGLDEQIDAAVDRAIEEATQEGAQGVTVVPSMPPWERNNDVPPEAVTISVAFFVSCAFVAVGLPLARAFARRMDRRGAPAVALPAETSSRFDRIEQAIDAVAIEVERISEGQRYSTKLMTEMRGLPAPNPLDAWPRGSDARQKEAVDRNAGDR